MIEENKYNIDDIVIFDVELNGKKTTMVGKIAIVDKFGTFEQHEEPSYDILVETLEGYDGPVLVKHIRQSTVRSKYAAD